MGEREYIAINLITPRNQMYNYFCAIKPVNNLSLILFLFYKFQSLIRSDFVLVSGDIVSNMKLDKVLEEHR